MRRLVQVVIAVFGLTSACDAEVRDTVSTPTSIQYTHIEKCTETVANPEAAVSIRTCPPIGSHKLSIIAQSPTLFTLQLTHDDTRKESEFDVLTGELPLEAGKVIEWHLKQGEPEFVILRLRWGSEVSPFVMNEYLTVSKVLSEKICTFAIIDVKTTSHANEYARKLIQTAVDVHESCDGRLR